ncbi:MAG: alpha-ketoacid dehydrogenase subunit beta [Candidatus Omnitrophica bacterium]|nr:alpha-ketoacid dehydrogenase subunit beta [Candidatus Omnitrophota bacterium]
MTYREALFESMHEALERHEEVVLLGQGVDDHKGTFGTTLGLAQKFGSRRVLDTPLSEEGMTGIAIGAALNGLYPIQTHIRADFAFLAMNQIVNLAAKYKYMFGGRFEVPMLIRMVVGRSWGQGAQHSQSPQSVFSHIPGLTVIMPAHPEVVLKSYSYIVSRHRGPVISLEHRLLYDLKFRVMNGSVSKDESPLRTRLIRSGRDVTILATSIMVLEAERAADYLAREAKIECEIIDLNCVSHPDANMICESVKKTGHLLVADTGWQAYGVSAEVTRIICEYAPSLLKAPVVTLGMKPSPCPTAKSLEDVYYPNQGVLIDAIARLVTGKKDHSISLPAERSMADVYKRFKGPF